VGSQIQAMGAELRRFDALQVGAVGSQSVLVEAGWKSLSLQSELKSIAANCSCSKKFEQNRSTAARGKVN
jgi:hypothetical protein